MNTSDKDLEKALYWRAGLTRASLGLLLAMGLIVKYLLSYS